MAPGPAGTLLPALVRRLARGKLVTVAAIRGRHVEVERLQQAAAGVADLMLVAVLDEKERAGFELVAAAVHSRLAAAGLHAEPLIGSAVAIVRVALGIPGRQ